MHALACTLLLAVSSFAAEPAAQPMDEKTRKQVLDHVLNGVIKELDAVIVKAFMTMDLESVPRKRREPAQIRKVEIQTAVRVQRTRDHKRGGVLTVSESCSSDESLVKLTLFGRYEKAGYTEIYEDELEKIMRQTECTEKELRCETSLTLFVDPAGKKPRRLAVGPADTLRAFAEHFRRGGRPAGGQTNFFGVGADTRWTCRRRAR